MFSKIRRSYKKKTECILTYWLSVHDIRQLLYRLFGSVLHTFVVLTDQPSFAARTISICQARTLEDSGTLENNRYKLRKW